MGEMDPAVKPAKKIDKKIVLGVILAAVVIAVVAVIALFSGNKIRAASMKVLDLQGTVTLTENGQERTVKENLRLKSGNALSTADESLVSIGLDDFKIITLDELSLAEFSKVGKKLDLHLKEGKLFCSVKKKLDEDEALAIHTSNLIVGIRGTDIVVEASERYCSVTVLDGSSSTDIIDPVTGETINMTTGSGKTTIVWMENGQIKYEQRDARPEDLPNFAIKYLQDHPDILDKVIEATGWDRESITGVDVSTRPEPVVSLPVSASAMEPTGTDGDSSTKADAGDGTGEAAGEGADGEDTVEGDAAGVDGDTFEGEAAEATLKSTVNGNAIPEDELAAARAKIAFENSENKAVLLDDGTIFDPIYYAAAHPDVVEKYGSSTDALLWHWLKYGKGLGYPPVAPTATAKVPETPHFDPNAGNTGSSSSSDDDDDDSGSSSSNGSNNSSGSNSGSIPTYNNVAVNSTFMIGNDPFIIDGNGNLVTQSDQSYISLPVIVNGTQYNSLDDVTIGTGLSAVTSGTVTKTIDGYRYDSSTNKLKIENNNPHNYTQTSTQIAAKDANGHTTTYNVNTLNAIDWAGSAVGAQAKNRDTTGAGTNALTYTITKQGPDSYLLDDDQSQIPPTLTESELNTWLSQHPNI